jgi:uncharacterized protein YqeY
MESIIIYNERKQPMRLQERLKKDLAEAMKAKDEEKKSILRVIMGEFGRQARKELEDGDVIKIIKKLIKSEKEVLEKSGGGAANRFIEVSESYLPSMASEEEIAGWISANIDMTQFRNKNQAMGPIMKQFGDRTDGNTVKKVLNSMP